MSNYRQIIVDCPHCRQPVNVFVGQTIIAATKGVGVITGDYRKESNE